jgi:hypothetical protein
MRKWKLDKAAKQRKRLRAEDLAVTKKIFKGLGKLHDEGLKKELQDLLVRPLLAQSIYLVDPFDASPVGRAIRAGERKG